MSRRQHEAKSEGGVENQRAAGRKVRSTIRLPALIDEAVPQTGHLPQLLWGNAAKCYHQRKLIPMNPDCVHLDST